VISGLSVRILYKMKTGRPRIKISATDAVKAKIGRRIKKESNALLRDRLRAVQLAFDGSRRYENIARQIGRARSSVQLWIEAFTAEGLKGLLRRKKAPGKISALQEAKVQADIAKACEGRWRTGPQFAAWIKEEHGIELCSTQTLLLAEESRSRTESSRACSHKKR